MMNTLDSIFPAVIAEDAHAVFMNIGRINSIFADVRTICARYSIQQTFHTTHKPYVCGDSIRGPRNFIYNFFFKDTRKHSINHIMFQIIVDDREQRVIPHFEQASLPANMSFKVSRINYGDYSVLYRERILFVIERKTWKDLASSMKDGRKHNVNKMIKIREDTGCHLMYLIEGNPLPSRKIRFCRIPYKNLRSHLDHIALRDGIHITHSKNMDDTVARIVEIVQNYITLKPSPIDKIDAELDAELDAEITNTAGGDAPRDESAERTDKSQATASAKKQAVGPAESKLKEKVAVSDEAIAYRIWSCVPYITEKTSCLFINKGHHVSDLILGKITKDEIYALKYDNGTIIGKRSAKIWGCSRPIKENNKYFSKMLVQINGVTKATADIILDAISWEDLLKGEITQETLSQIQKSDSGRKVGKKVSESIVKYLCPNKQSDQKIE
jgi:ERCC4-type nuclease